MRICHYCKQDIHDAVSCNAPAVYESDGPSYARIPYGVERHVQGGNNAQRCPNCLVMTGMLHHPGCLAEECPACHKALATCQCALMFRHGENHQQRSRRGQSPRKSEAKEAKEAAKPLAPPVPIPMWHPTRAQREDALTAVRIGRLSGCWNGTSCRITVCEKQVLHENDGVIDVIPLTDDLAVVAELQSIHAGRGLGALGVGDTA